MKKVSREDLQNLINTMNSVVVVYSSSNCSPCQSIKRVIESEFESKYKDASFVMIDVAENSELVSELNIRHTPTIMVYHKGAKQRFSIMDGNVRKEDDRFISDARTIKLAIPYILTRLGSPA
jgi:thiol-disulfide isomerase/thioredoxin